jgi:hypothetical protein
VRRCTVLPQGTKAVPRPHLAHPLGRPRQQLEDDRCPQREPHQVGALQAQGFQEGKCRVFKLPRERPLTGAQLLQRQQMLSQKYYYKYCLGTGSQDPLPCTSGTQLPHRNALGRAPNCYLACT